MFVRCSMLALFKMDTRVLNAKRLGTTLADGALQPAQIPSDSKVVLVASYDTM